MKDLHEAAQEKFKIEKAKYDLRLAKQKAKADAENDARAAKSNVESDEKQFAFQADADLRAKRSVLEEEKKKKFYALEEWKRMGLFALESDLKTRQLRARTERNAQLAERALQEAKNDECVRRKKLENEYAKKKMDIESDEHVKINGLISQHEATVQRIQTDAASRKNDIDRKLRQTLEDIDRGKGPINQKADEPKGDDILNAKMR